MEWIIAAAVGTIIFMLMLFIVCYLLNPYFWQGLRNSRFIDELKRMDKDKLIKP